MGNFFSLLSVENTKLWKRVSSKVMIIILIAIIVGLCGLSKAAQGMVNSESKSSSSDGVSVSTQGGVGVEAPDSDRNLTWQQKLEAEDKALQSSIDSMEKSSKQIEKNSLDSMKMQLAENKYRISNNIQNDGTKDFWYNVETSGFGKIIALFAIIACSALVAGEFSDNTMKTMIPRPFSRFQILTAKFIAVFLYSLALMVIGFVFVVASIAMFFGTSGFNGFQMLWTGGSVLYLPGFAAALTTTGLDFLEVLVYVILAFGIAALSRSRALTTGLAIFLMFAGSFTELAAMYFPWGKFILFSDTAFSTFMVRGASFYGITLGSALLICLAYCVVFLFGGYFAFIKRDIN